MENIRHLIEVLKSQISLYSELAEFMDAEKHAIVSWAVDETLDITKKKESLLKKERIQEEARSALLSKIASGLSKETVVLSEVIDYAAGNDESVAKELHELGTRIVELVETIHAENLTLRVLYNTNSRMINEFFTALGMSEGNAYGPGARAKNTTSMHNIIG